MFIGIHVGPDEVSRKALAEMSVSGLSYWRMRYEYAAAWVRKVGGLDVAEALYQRFHGYPKHLHGAVIGVETRAGTVVLHLKGGTGWDHRASGPTLAAALRNLTMEVATRERIEEDRLNTLGTPAVTAIEETLT